MTAIATLPVLLQQGTHGARPAASAVGSGALYACTTHGLIYQMLAGSWGTWFTPGGFANPMTTAEDIIYGGASGAPTRKAKGSDGTFLGVAAGALLYTAVTDALLSTSDITTNNASTSKHGFLKKLSNSATDYMDGTGNWSTPAGGGGGATPLGITRYAPGSDTTIGTTSSGTQGDVDATNAKVVFTAPASGKVLVHVGCAMNMSGASNGFWGLRESSTDIAGPQLVNSATAVTMVAREFYVTGVSAGSHTYKAAFSVAGSTMSLYGGPTYGPIEMTVWEAI